MDITYGWKLWIRDDDYIIGEDSRGMGGDEIGIIYGSNEISKARATLAAQAPKLLNALKMLRDFMALEEGDGADKEGRDIAKIVNETIKQADVYETLIEDFQKRTQS